MFAVNESYYILVAERRSRTDYLTGYEPGMVIPFHSPASRGSRARTDDLMFPKHALYQTEPYPEISRCYVNCFQIGSLMFS